MTRILHIDASQRREASASRKLSAAIVNSLAANGPAEIDRLDLAETQAPPVTEDWIVARQIAPEEQTPAQRAVLAASDALVARLRNADAIVIGTPIYNFGAPAPLKAWIDMIARPRVTFRYTEGGPVGLVTGKKAYLAVASGGTAIEGPVDFLTPYLRHALGFVGIKDIAVFDAGRAAKQPDGVREALAAIEAHAG